MFLFFHVSIFFIFLFFSHFYFFIASTCLLIRLDAMGIKQNLKKLLLDIFLSCKAVLSGSVESAKQNKLKHKVKAQAWLFKQVDIRFAEKKDQFCTQVWINLALTINVSFNLHQCLSMCICQYNHSVMLYRTALIVFIFQSFHMRTLKWLDILRGL